MRWTLARREFLLAAAGLTGTTLLAACGRSRSRAARGVGGGAAAAGAASAAAPDGERIPSPAPGVPDGYTALPRPYRTVPAPPGRGGTVTTFQVRYHAPVPPRELNQFWRELEGRLGVTLAPSFARAGEDYDRRSAALLAGGDLPDLFFLAPTLEQARALRGGAFADLAPYLTGAALGDFPNLAAFAPQVWRTVGRGGALHGVPRPRHLAGDTLIYRLDWAEGARLARPGSAEELFRLLAALTREDPDLNGVPDTFGLGTIGGELLPAGLAGIFRVPNDWRAGPDGALTADLETEEFRAAVAFARRLHEAGLYHPEAPAMSAALARDLFNGSRIGAYQDAWHLLPSLRDTLRRVATNPRAAVAALIPPGPDGGAGVTYNRPGHAGYTALPARLGRDRERTRELLGILNYLAAPFGSEEWAFLAHGLEGIHHERAADGAPVRTEVGIRELGGAGSFPDFGNLANPPPVFYFPAHPADPPLLQELCRQLLALGVDDPTAGLVSATAEARGRELARLRRDRLATIVAGREPLGALDALAADWRAGGGDQIRREYEEALRA